MSEVKKGTSVTVESIQGKIIAEEFHSFAGSTLTICILTLENGFTVTGESACVDPANYDKVIGERIAKEAAFDKIWLLEGYLLQERLFVEAITN